MYVCLQIHWLSTWTGKIQWKKFLHHNTANFGLVNWTELNSTRQMLNWQRRSAADKLSFFTFSAFRIIQVVTTNIYISN